MPPPPKIIAPMPSPLRNGDFGAGSPFRHHHFRSTVSEQKLRRLNTLILLLRIAAFCFTLAAAIFMGTDSSRSQSWTDFFSFRFMLAANAIVALYSLFEMGASIFEIQRGVTLLPETLQLWFDFSHDQVFAYLLLAAEAAGAWEARELRRGRRSCSGAFCVQADISVALGFVGFGFIAVSGLMSGYRLACYSITGSRFNV